MPGVLSNLLKDIRTRILKLGMIEGVWIPQITGKNYSSQAVRLDLISKKKLMKQ